eukprot:5272164-Alexandrium_andersonii.AAC.1
MSASLVGSEMCIRDSPQGAPGLHGCHPPRPAAGRRHQWAGRPPHHGRACLLYTSDAADDM